MYMTTRYIYQHSFHDCRPSRSRQTLKSKLFCSVRRSGVVSLRRHARPHVQRVFCLRTRFRMLPTSTSQQCCGSPKSGPAIPSATFVAQTAGGPPKQGRALCLAPPHSPLSSTALAMPMHLMAILVERLLFTSPVEKERRAQHHQNLMDTGAGGSTASKQASVLKWHPGARAQS